jgi:hypothetical protein
MKFLFLLACLWPPGDSTATAQLADLVFRGSYNGTNLFLYNPAQAQGHCIAAVYVNGEAVELKAQAALEIDLSRFKRDDEVVVLVRHQSGCLPKLLNPRALSSPEQFELADLVLTDSSLAWQAHAGPNDGQYFVEAFRNNFWRVEQSVTRAKRAPGQRFVVPVYHLPGQNKYRIKFLDDFTGKTHYSAELTHHSDKSPASHLLGAGLIEFSEPLAYEVRDLQHRLVARGRGEVADCAQLADGQYLLLYHHRTVRFDKSQGRLQLPGVSSPAATATKKRPAPPTSPRER